MSPTRPPESSNERAERAWIYDKVAHRYRGMTIDQFIVRLEKTPRDWFLEGAAIRRPSEDRMVRPYNCPLTAVGCWPNEMETLVALEIMHAADASYGYDAGLRERLLTACELTKGPTNA